MSLATTPRPTLALDDTSHDSRRWWALAAIAIAQLMIVVDATIMNIALPSAQRDLGLSDSSRQWVITIYALLFGSLLLLGGPLSDLLGRKRALIIGLVGFALASAIGGAAQGPASLLTARAVQGVFAALLTPSALAMLSSLFPSPADRGKAFGIFGTIMGSGSGIGVMLGGILTDVASWRWAMYVNVPIAVIAGIGIVYAVRSVPTQSNQRVDLVGAFIATSAMVALVFGFSRAESRGWTSIDAFAPLIVGAVLLPIFIVVEKRVAGPLLPPQLLLDRQRSGSFLAAFCWGASIFGGFFFISFYLQNVLGLSPFRTGLAFLPYTMTVILTARFVGRQIRDTPPRKLICPGLISIGAGLLLLGTLQTDSHYAVHVLPVFVLLGAGTAFINITVASAVTLNAGKDTGIASAMSSTSSQLGGALGTAVLSSLAGDATARYASDHSGNLNLTNEAAVYGFSIASLAAGGFVLVAAVAIFAAIGPTRDSN